MDSALGSASICGDALSERSVLFWHPTFESGQDEFVIQSLRILDPDDFEYLVVLSLHRFLVAPLDWLLTISWILHSEIDIERVDVM